MSIIISISRNRIKAELSDFRFFFFGFSRIRSSFVGFFISRGRRRFLSWSRRKNFTVCGLGCEIIQSLVPISAAMLIGFFLFPIFIDIDLVDTLKGLFNTRLKGILFIVILMLGGYSGVLLLMILTLARSWVLRFRTGPFFGFSRRYLNYNIRDS